MAEKVTKRDDLLKAFCKDILINLKHYRPLQFFTKCSIKSPGLHIDRQTDRQTDRQSDQVKKFHALFKLIVRKMRQFEIPVRGMEQQQLTQMFLTRDFTTL